MRCGCNSETVKWAVQDQEPNREYSVLVLILSGFNSETLLYDTWILRILNWKTCEVIVFILQMMTQYADFMFQIGMLDESQRDYFQTYSKLAVQHIQNKDFRKAFDVGLFAYFCNFITYMIYKWKQYLKRFEKHNYQVWRQSFYMPHVHYWSWKPIKLSKIWAHFQSDGLTLN